MKKHIKNSAFSLAALCLLLLLGLGSQAQSTASNKEVVTDTTEVIVGNKVITITIDTLTGKKDVQVTSRAVADTGPGDAERHESHDSVEIKAVHTDPIGIDLGVNFPLYNGSFNAPATLSDFETEPLRSTNVAIHLLPTHFNMAHGKVSFLTAITFDNNRYQFRNNVTPQPRQPYVTMQHDSVSLKKNKLNMWYGQIPLMLSFQTRPTNPKKSFHIAVGGFAGLFLSANTKTKSEENGKIIRKDDFNLNPLRYGLTARIGYGNLELYSTYTLSPLFRDGQGPAFNNINFGIALTGMM